MMIGLFGKSLGHSLNIYADTHTCDLHTKKKKKKERKLLLVGICWQA